MDNTQAEDIKLLECIVGVNYALNFRDLVRFQEMDDLSLLAWISGHPVTYTVLETYGEVRDRCGEEVGVGGESNEPEEWEGGIRRYNPTEYFDLGVSGEELERTFNIYKILNGNRSEIALAHVAAARVKYF